MIDDRGKDMPCNLAVTIQKAAVNNKELAALLTPQVVKTLVESFVQQHEAFKPYQPIRLTARGGMVYANLGDYTRSFSIIGTEVYVNFPRTEKEKGEEIAQLLTTLLSRGADRLFAEKVKKSLQKFGKVQASQATVKDGTQVVPVTMLKFEV
jgi:hypothetical protein